LNKNKIIDSIISYYRNSHITKKIQPDLAQFKFSSDYILHNLNQGIGDGLMLYQFNSKNDNYHNIQVFFNPELKNIFNKYNSYIGEIFNPNLNKKNFWICVAQANFDCKGGHFLQKIQYLCDLNNQIKPRPLLNNIHNTIKNKVILTFDKGPTVQTHIHPKARTLYPETKNLIQDFINKNLYKYNFVEVGKTFSGLENVENKTNFGIEKTAQEIGECEYFFGIHNGLMHIATAFEKKCIIIINFPSAKELYLPCIKEIDIPDVDWLYPQNIHLHQDDEGQLVKKISYNNIEKAFNEELYPYYSEEFLDLKMDNIV
jgi:hypothetical protein